MSYHGTDTFGRTRGEEAGVSLGAGVLDRLRALFRPPPATGLTGARDALDLARAIGAARRLRGDLLDPDLFAEPAWDLLLELYIATRDGVELAVSAATTAIEAPISVSLRWIKELETRGLVVRRIADDDKRRDYLALSQKGLQKMDALLGLMLRG